MTTGKPDRRKQRTLNLLREAFMQLVVEKGYEHVTIQDITERANVSRTTFYLHFHTVEELLLDGMEAMYNELVDSVPKDLWKAAVEQNMDALMVDARDFEHVAQYAAFYKAMLSNRGSAAFIMRVQSYLAGVVKSHVFDLLLPPEHQPRVPLDALANYMAGAQIGLIRWWLTEDEMRHTPQEMARMMSEICLHGMWWAVGLPPLETDS